MPRELGLEPRRRADQHDAEIEVPDRGQRAVDDCRGASSPPIASTAIQIIGSSQGSGFSGSWIGGFELTDREPEPTCYFSEPP